MFYQKNYFNNDFIAISNCFASLQTVCYWEENICTKIENPYLFLNGFVAETVIQVRLTELDQRSSQPHLNSWRYPLINYLDDGDEVVVVLGFMWTTRLTILCLYSPYLKTKCENRLLIGSSDDFTRFYPTNLRIF